jgi:hypothetical protein
LATQGDSVRVGEYPPHHDNETSSSTVDNPQHDADLTMASLANAGQWYSFDEPGTISLLDHTFPNPFSTANSRDVVTVMPLRPGEATRGGITSTLPVPTQRIATATRTDQTRAPSTSQGGTVIRVCITFLFGPFYLSFTPFQGSGTPIDVLANRHAKHAPYRLPPTPPLSITSEASILGSSRRGSTSGYSLEPTTTLAPTTTRRTQPGRSRHSLPNGVRDVIALAKSLFRLKLLTVNAMWPDSTARLQAKDQITSARRTMKMESRKF